MAIAQRIESLKKQHATIDHKLHEEYISPSCDTLNLCDLKRRKLHLKDEIMRLANIEEAAA